jgi:hypothetical protein
MDSGNANHHGQEDSNNDVQVNFGNILSPEADFGPL